MNPCLFTLNITILRIYLDRCPDGNERIQLFHFSIGDRNTALRPIPQPMQPANEALPVFQSVNLDISAWITCVFSIDFIWIGNAQI